MEIGGHIPEEVRTTEDDLQPLHLFRGPVDDGGAARVGKYLQRRVSYDELVESALIEAFEARPDDAELPRLIQKRVLEQSVCRWVVFRCQQPTPDVVSQIQIVPAPVSSQIRSFTQDDTTILAATPRSVPGDKLGTYATEVDRMIGVSRYTSYGTCALCGKRTTKAGMSRHLGSCLAEHEPSRGKAARLFRIRIEDAYSPIFWMDVEMRANSTLEELDDFEGRMAGMLRPPQ